MMDFTGYLDKVNNCNGNDPLLSDTNLGQYLKKISLECLIDRFDKLYIDLDVEQLIRTDQGLARDYRGLGELMKFDPNEIETRFKKTLKPTKCLVQAYMNKYIYEKKISAYEFLIMLEKLERFDVIDDLIPTLVEVAQNDLNFKIKIDEIGLSDSEVSSRLSNNLPSEKLTIDDYDGFRVLYDAFICFAKDDFPYAMELIQLLENCGKRVATAEDLLPGHFENDAIVKLINERCRKVLTILTPNFLLSKECEIQAKFASEMAIKSHTQTPKVIPIIYEPCDDERMPYMLRTVSKIDMTKKALQQWQLKKILSCLDEDSTGSSMSNQLNDLSRNRYFERGDPFTGTISTPIISLVPSTSNNSELSIQTSTNSTVHDSGASPVPSSPSLSSFKIQTSSQNPLKTIFKHVKRIVRPTDRSGSNVETRNNVEISIDTQSVTQTLASNSSISPQDTNSRTHLLTSNSHNENKEI